MTWNGEPLEVVFARTHHCEAAATQSGTRRLDGRTLEIAGESYLEVFKTLVASLVMADAAGAP